MEDSGVLYGNYESGGGCLESAPKNLYTNPKNLCPSATRLSNGQMQLYGTAKPQTFMWNCELTWTE